MGRRIIHLSITTATVLLFVFTLGGCNNMLLQELIVDVTRALGTIVTINITGNGSTDPAGEIVVEAGDNSPIAISATASTDWIFVQWQGSRVTFADAYAADTTFQLTGGDTTISAVFADTTLGVPLMINNNGHGSTDQDGLQYIAFLGTTGTITATPDTGYELTLSDWIVETGGATVNEILAGSQYTITVTSPLPTIALADFALKTYTLTVQDDGNGSTVPSGGVTVSHGEAQSITATISDPARYVFGGWTEEVGTATIGNTSAQNTTATLETGDATVQANFDKINMYWTTYTGPYTVNRAADTYSYYANLVSGSAPCTGIDLDVVNETVYFADLSGRIWKCNLDGSGLTTVYSGPQMYSIALDLVNDKLYFAGSAGGIGRINLDGSGYQMVSSASAPRGIAVDGAGGYVYWTDINFSRISRADITGVLPASPAILVNGIFTGLEIDLDLTNSKMYWVEAGGSIKRANLNGTSVELLVSAGLDYPSGIDLDVANDWMYITDQFGNMIYQYTLDGSGPAAAFPVQNGPRNIAIDTD
jgi:hypothetical protein